MKRDVIYLIVFLTGLLPQTLQASNMIRFQAVTDSSSRSKMGGTSTPHDRTAITLVAGFYIETAAYVTDWKKACTKRSNPKSILPLPII
jgi:hypothetical protein